MTLSMVTTSDNPYNPFDQFKQWNAFDIAHGYNTCAYLDRVSYDTPSMSEKERAMSIEAAVDEIVKLNLTGNYVKVTKEVDDLL